MSYCRWSSMDFQCDVYVYADIGGGYTCHVAGRRRKNRPSERYTDIIRETIVEPDVVDKKSFRERMDQYDKEVSTSDWMDLPESPFGDTFNMETSNEMADALETLAGKGFSVPDYAIEALREQDDDEWERIERELDEKEKGS